MPDVRLAGHVLDIMGDLVTAHRALILAILAFGATKAPGEDLRGIYARTQPSVLLLKTYDRLGADAGQGTGFLVAGGLVVTNHHVIDGARSVTAIGHADRPIRILALLVGDEKNDIAILRAEPIALPALRLALQPAVVGQRVIVVGNHLGLAGTLSEGLVSGLREDGLTTESPDQHQGAPLLQITAPISHGSSGSPVMDETGNVVGVAVSGYMGAQNLNFAVPVSVISHLLESIKPGDSGNAYGAPPGAPSLARNLTVSAVVLGLIAVALYLLGGRRPPFRSTPPNTRGTSVKPFRGRA